MRDLRLIGVAEDGSHVTLSDGAGGRYRLPLDEALRTAARGERGSAGQLQIEIDGAIRPREVQTFIRAGLSAEDIAQRCGWSVERIRRYEGPILAEREHVSSLARRLRLRARGHGIDTTLERRVRDRLSSRGVDDHTVGWDASRDEGSPWVVAATFPAGGRERTASWQFDVAGQTLVALDDEARWLSEDDPGDAPIPPPHPTGRSRTTTVYDVEAEGGVDDGAAGAASAAGTSHPAGATDTDKPIDLVAAMRSGSSARRRRGRRRAGPTRTGSGRPAGTVGSGTTGDRAGEDPALPLDDLPTPVESEARDEHGAADDPEDAPDRAAAPAEASRPARRSGRPSVPAWDDIMFGRSDPS